MTILIFFVVSIAILLLSIFIFTIFYKKRSNANLEKFITQSVVLKPIILKNIKLRYWTINIHRMQIYPNNVCDLYLFDTFLVIARRQNFIFKVAFPPILIGPDPKQAKEIFSYLEIYKPDKFIFKERIKGEIDIKVTDLTYMHYKIDITLKELIAEQKEQLQKIKSWSL